MAYFSLRAKAVKIVFFKLKGQSLRDGMMCHLRASRLVLVTGRNLPFFVDSTGLDAVVDGTQHADVSLNMNVIFSGREGLIMIMRWDEHLAIFFVYYSELHLGTLGVRRIQRAWRAHRSSRRRLALCMASDARLGTAADACLKRMIQVLCVQDLMKLV